MATSSSFGQKLFAQRGIGFAFLSAMVFALNGLSVNLVTKTISVRLALFVSILAYLPSVVFIRWENRYSSLDTVLILMAGLFSAGNLTSGAISFKLTNVGDASAIIFSKPLLCALLGKFLLDEPFGIYDTGILIANFAGVILIAKPPFLFHSSPGDADAEKFVGSLSALACAISSSLQYIAARKLVERETHDPALVLTSMSIIGFLMYGASILFADFQLINGPVSTTEYVLLFIASFSSVTGFLFLLLALNSQNVSVVALVATSEIVGSYLLQALFTSDPIGWTSVAGALMITASAVWFAIKGLFSNPNEEEDG